MAYTPPQPGKLSALVAAAQSCTYSTSASAFATTTGELRFPVLTATSAPGVDEWEVDDNGSKCPLFLLSSTVYTILRDGTLSTDGWSITYSGQTFYFRATRHADGSQWVDPAHA